MNAMRHDELVVPDHRAIVTPLYEEVHVEWFDHGYHVTSTRLASEPDCHCYPDCHHANVMPLVVAFVIDGHLATVMRHGFVEEYRHEI